MNAIILAAGLGSRLLSITTAKPKPLIEIDKVPIIERQIRCLHEIGIREIYIVVGYKAESFNYLMSKYGVQLIYNTNFARYNNIYSLYLVRHLIDHSYILDGDVFLYNNFLSNRLFVSTYFSRFSRKLKGEWMVEVFDKKLQKIIIYDATKSGANPEGAYIISGVSYWVTKEALVIKEYFKKLIDDNGNFYNHNNSTHYWDQIIYDNINCLSIEVEMLGNGNMLEIDDVEDLQSAINYSQEMLTV